MSFSVVVNGHSLAYSTAISLLHLMRREQYFDSLSIKKHFQKRQKRQNHILGDPGADSRGEGKSKRMEKYGTKKSKERREEPLGTMSYQTSSKRSPLFCLLIGQKNTKVFWHQSEVRTAATVWNWSGKTLSPGALLAVLYFSSCHIFPPVQTFPHPYYLPLDLRGWQNHSDKPVKIKKSSLQTWISKSSILSRKTVNQSFYLVDISACKNKLSTGLIKN